MNGTSKGMIFLHIKTVILTTIRNRIFELQIENSFERQATEIVSEDLKLDEVDPHKDRYDYRILNECE